MGYENPAGVCLRVFQFWCISGVGPNSGECSILPWEDFGYHVKNACTATRNSFQRQMYLSVIRYFIVKSEDNCSERGLCCVSLIYQSHRVWWSESRPSKCYRLCVRPWICQSEGCQAFLNRVHWRISSLFVRLVFFFFCVCLRVSACARVCVCYSGACKDSHPIPTIP